MALPLYPYPHGTRTGYTSHACRCRPCTDAQRDYMREFSRRGLAPDDHRHGSLNGYKNYGCRCQPCTVACQKDNAQRRARRRERESLWAER